MAEPFYIEQKESAGGLGIEVRTKVWSRTVAYDSVIVLPYIELSNFKVPALCAGHVKQIKAAEVQKLVAKVWDTTEHFNG